MAALNLEPSAEDKAFESAAIEADKSAPAQETQNATETAKPAESKEQDSTGNGRDEKGRFASQKGESDEGGEVKTEQAKEQPKAKEPPRVAAPKIVPVGALRAERQGRQDAERIAQQTAEQLKTVMAELAQLKNPPKPAPDPNQDPDGYNRWEIEQLKTKVSTYEKETEAQKQQREQYEAATNRINEAGQYETASLAEFGKARPDQYGQYKDAVQHIHKSMSKILSMAGVREPDMVENTIRDMFLRAVEGAKVDGENAAERIWNLAGSLGFTGVAQVVQQEQVQEEEQVQAEQKADPALDAISKSLDKLTTLQAGQRAAKSVASSGGTSSKGLTLNEVLASAQGASLLEETELDKMSTRDAKRKLFKE